MQEYRFKRVTVLEYDITVYADTFSRAYARATVGGLDWIREKEGVEVSDCVENTTTKEFNDDDS